MIDRKEFYLEKLLELVINIQEQLPLEQIGHVLSIIIGNNGTKSKGGLIQKSYDLKRKDLGDKFYTQVKLLLKIADDNLTTLPFVYGYLLDVIEFYSIEESKEFLIKIREKNYIESFNYSKKGAEEGNKYSMKKLSECYLEGKGCIIDIDTKINEYQIQLDKEDNIDTISEINDKITYQKAKKQNYKNIEKELNYSVQSQISKVDKDARSVILHRNIVNVGYNIQAGSDSKHKLFANAQTRHVNDTHALAEMALEAKQLLGVETMKTLTDKGYTTGTELAKCEQNNIIPFSSPKEHSSQKNGLYSMNIFKYDKANDTYTCPAGQLMITNGTIYNKANHKVKHYKTKACKHCAVRNLCTTNKKGRFIERGIYQQTLENNQKRVNQNPNYYRLRQQITEHQFGTLKRQWGFTYTLMKGKQNVLSEVYLCFSVYNLIRILEWSFLRSLPLCPIKKFRFT